MPQVTINGVTYEVYADVATADDYLAARIGSTWSSQTDDTKAQALVSSTRYLDSQPWQGSKTSDAQLLEWPRTGVTYRDGTAVDDSVVPQEIIDACMLIADMLVVDNTLTSNANFGNNTKRLKAGSAEIEYFRPTFGTRFPTEVQALIAQFLSGQGASSVTVGGFSSGTGAPTALENWGRTEGFS